MMPRLIELAWLMSHLTPQGRRTPPVPDTCAQTIDGMLFVGIRPASHHAA